MDPMRREDSWDASDVNSWIGSTVRDGSGDKIGKVEDVFVDEQTRRPEWLQVSTGLFGGTRLVPIVGVRSSADGLIASYSKDQVEDSPSLDTDALSEEQERELYSHYGVAFSDQGSDTLLPADREARGQTRGGMSDDAMTRSEEKLDVHKVRRPSELVRLKKRVVTEHVTQTVPVEREELVIEREPITDANRDAALSGPDIKEGEHELVLEQEDVAVEKRVEPQERVRLDKQVETEERIVEEDVRQERIDVEREKGPGKRAA